MVYTGVMYGMHRSSVRCTLALELRYQEQCIVNAGAMYGVHWSSVWCTLALELRYQEQCMVYTGLGTVGIFPKTGIEAEL